MTKQAKTKAKANQSHHINKQMEMNEVGDSDEHLLYGISSPGGRSTRSNHNRLVGTGGADYNPQEAGSDDDDILRNSSTIDDDVASSYSRSSSSTNKKKSTCTRRYLPIITRSLTALLAISLIGLVWGLLPYFAVEAGKKGHINQTLYWIAGCFVLITVPISVLGIVQHLVNWYMPQVQKVRRIMMYFVLSQIWTYSILQILSLSFFISYPVRSSNTLHGTNLLHPIMVLPLLPLCLTLPNSRT